MLRAMPRPRSRRPYWANYKDTDLLDLRFCDLDLRVGRGLVAQRMERLYEELHLGKLRFRPHYWLSEEWFSPDGVPGIAIPFYLAHPRLARLEAKQMFEVEGGTDEWCMQLLRHEAGHAIDSGYKLHRRHTWRRTFGRYGRPYPDSYVPNTRSKNYVLHLDRWYAQSHPAEDFAETFAVWLRPGSQWWKHYAGWPVLRKLEYMDGLMHSIAGRRPVVHSRRHVEPLKHNRRTLREHYEQKRRHYSINVPEVYDSELRRLFPEGTPGAGRKPSAAVFLRCNQAELCELCSRGTGEHPYVFAHLVQEMIQRCRAMRLYLTRTVEDTRVDVAIFLTTHILTNMHKVRHRVAV